MLFQLLLARHKLIRYQMGCALPDINKIMILLKTNDCLHLGRIYISVYDYIEISCQIPNNGTKICVFEYVQMQMELFNEFKL